MRNLFANDWWVLVMGRGALPAAGPVACGGLWVMTAVDSSSSRAVTCAAHTAMVFARNQSWRAFWWRDGERVKAAPRPTPVVAYDL